MQDSSGFDKTPLTYERARELVGGVRHGRRLTRDRLRDSAITRLTGNGWYTHIALPVMRRLMRASRQAPSLGQGDAVVVSTHIPKTAGTSFRHVLELLFGSGLCLEYREVRDLPPPCLRHLPTQVKCVHGHFPTDTFDAVERPKQYVTLMRHPIRRLVSNYLHFVRETDSQAPWVRSVHDKRMSLLDFAMMEGVSEHVSHYYIGSKRLEEFSFVGITERLGRSVTCFCRLLGLRRGIHVPMSNRTPLAKISKPLITREEYEKLAAMNREDLRLYGEALRRFEEIAQQVDTT